MNTGEKIKKIRTMRHWSQKELAEVASVSEISIRKYESGERTPKKQQLLMISEALDVPVKVLLDDEFLVSGKLSIRDALAELIAIDKSFGITVHSSSTEGEESDEEKPILIEIKNKELSECLRDWAKKRDDYLESLFAFNKNSSSDELFELDFKRELLEDYEFNMLSWRPYSLTEDGIEFPSDDAV